MKCLNDMCNNEAHSRGLCTTCYGYAQDMIKSGTHTEEQLIKAGKMLVPYASTRLSSKKGWMMDTGGVE